MMKWWEGSDSYKLCYPKNNNAFLSIQFGLVSAWTWSTHTHTHINTTWSTRSIISSRNNKFTYIINGWKKKWPDGIDGKMRWFPISFPKTPVEFLDVLPHIRQKSTFFPWNIDWATGVRVYLNDQLFWTLFENNGPICMLDKSKLSTGQMFWIKKMNKLKK